MFSIAKYVLLTSGWFLKALHKLGFTGKGIEANKEVGWNGAHHVISNSKAIALQLLSLL